MGSHSPYSINHADPPQWRPGEDVAAGAFLGITFFLVLEVNVMIFRAFKKRQGLYFWSMQIGSMGILMRSVGIILKNFGSPSTNAIWPLYTLFNLAGWAIYVTAQSLVLYSRLHLVMQNQKIQRYVFRMILSTIFTFIIPTMVVAWPAYNTSDREMSSVWSPRLGIMNRYTQIGYTITESTISGLYIWSLTRLLRWKPNIQRRRVMTDLIYVNVIVIAFDFISVVFTYTNQSAFSHPVRTFSYILKLRLEFVVLNQLMDIAARGVRCESFRRNRYYLTANRENMPSHGNAPSQEAKTSHMGLANEKGFSQDSAQITLPSSMPLLDFISSPKPAYQTRPTNRSVSDFQIPGLESEPGSNSFDNTDLSGRKSSSSDGNPLTQTAQQGTGFKLPPASEDFEHWPSGHSKHSKSSAFGHGDHSHGGNSGNDEDEEEEEDIDLYKWERGGAVVMEVPWFRSKVDA
ncbi:hypothetical protein MMC22_002020 [Lobaria immixta]|nr:hypothetical protein [Lobaria immixta]